MTATTFSADNNHSQIERYYRWHAPIYDLTRWMFLFGRSALMEYLATGPAPEQVIEVGCGTGRNLAALARRFPQARLTGIDLSVHMLVRARRRLAEFGPRVRWLQGSFEVPLNLEPPCDLVLFSYSLSMMNPGWETALRAAVGELKPGGQIAVVDFAGTPWTWFRRWMACNQVLLDDHLLPALRGEFETRACVEMRAFGGVWRYLLFLGVKPQPSAAD